MSKRPQAAEAEEKSLETLTRTMTETSEQQVSWETIPLIEPISLSLGYKLVRWWIKRRATRSPSVFAAYVR